MRPPESARPRLRKREIVFAVAAGAVAAGGAALLLSDDVGPGPGAVPGFPAPGAITYEVAEFDAISTSGPQDIVILRGDTPSVRAEGSPDALAQLEAVVEGDTLTIRPKRGFDWGDWRRLSSATFHVTLPRLESLAQAGSGNVRIDRVQGESFESSIAGSGELTIGLLEVDEADFNIGGGGNITASGKARQTRISIGGSGDIGASGLLSETASVSIAGSGDVELTVTDEANVSILGSGNVDIAGPGRCSVTRFGSGDVNCEGGGGTD
jgi:hypothetical protein